MFHNKSSMAVADHNWIQNVVGAQCHQNYSFPKSGISMILA